MDKNFLFNKKKYSRENKSVLRWGFAGMPASHGVTKSHRRAGHIGSGKHLKLYYLYSGVYIFCKIITPHPPLKSFFIPRN